MLPVSLFSAAVVSRFRMESVGSGYVLRGLKCRLRLLDTSGSSFCGGKLDQSSDPIQNNPRHVLSIGRTHSRDRSARHPSTPTATVFFFFQWVMSVQLTKCTRPAGELILDRRYSCLVRDQDMYFLTASHHHDTGLCCAISYIPV